MTSLNLFQRAHRRLPLTPEERAILKFVYLAVASATATGLTAVAQVVGTSGQHINWTAVGYVFLGSFSVTLYETGRKWVSANGDGPLGSALQLLSEAVKRTDIAKQVAQATTTLTAGVPGETEAPGGAHGA